MSARAAMVRTFGVLVIAVLSERATAQAAQPCTAFAPEASARSGLSIDVVLRVMRAESGGNPRALSSRGAIGCMQIMPATWRELAMRFDLGRDPWDARANMIGGALYLSEMGRRFGFPAAFAAYNAGPARYEQHLSSGASLPLETQHYVARLASQPGVRAPLNPGSRTRWQQADLFIAQSRLSVAATQVAAGDQTARKSRLFPLQSDTAADAANAR